MYPRKLTGYHVKTISGYRPSRRTLGAGSSSFDRRSYHDPIPCLPPGSLVLTFTALSWDLGELLSHGFRGSLVGRRRWELKGDGLRRKSRHYLSKPVVIVAHGQCHVITRYAMKKNPPVHEQAWDLGFFSKGNSWGWSMMRTGNF